jgi:hypothetical protein
MIPPFPQPETRIEALANAVYAMGLSSEEHVVTVARLQAAQAQAWASIARCLPEAEQPKNNFAEALTPWPDQPQVAPEMIPVPLDTPDQVMLDSRTYDVLMVLATRYVRASITNHVVISREELISSSTHLGFDVQDNGSVTVTVEP